MFNISNFNSKTNLNLTLKKYILIQNNIGKYRLQIEFHFAGNCHDPDVVLEIQEKFIEHWKTTDYKEGCLHDIDKCIPSNVQVDQVFPKQGYYVVFYYVIK
jgi:hypothetical protein